MLAIQNRGGQQGNMMGSSSSSSLMHSGMQQTGGTQQMGMSNGMQTGMQSGMAPGTMSQYGMQQMVPYNGTQGGMGPGGGVLAIPGQSFGQTTQSSGINPNFQAVHTRKPLSYEPGRAKAEERAALAALKPMTKEAKERGLARTTKPLATRLAGVWDKEEVLYSLDAKIDGYARRHGGQKALLRERRAVRQTDGQERQQELAMLDKMRKDEEAGALMLPVEQAADQALRSGFREFIDYAVDEVERYSSIAKLNVRQEDFDWSGCGEWHDVPAQRKSAEDNRVDGPASHLPGPGNGTDVLTSAETEGMFAMDFLRDFCHRNPYDQPPPEDYCLQRMANYSRDMLPPTLYRADNGLQLFQEEYDPTLDENLPCQTKMSSTKVFKDREWATNYSTV